MIEGNVSNNKTTEGQVVSTENISGNVNQTQSISGNTNASATIEGNINDVQTLKGTIASSSAISGNVNQAQGINGNPNFPDNNYNNASNKPSINGVELVGNKKTEDLKLIYEKLLNLPKINGVELTGDKTTKELGIEATGGTDINIIDKFDYLKKFQSNDIYNANATNGSVDWIIQAILEAFNREVLVDINVVVNPQTFQVISNDGSLSDVVNTLDLGGTTRVICQLAGTNIKVVLQLAMVDGTYARFTTVMKADLGAGEMKYLLGINISERYTGVIVEPLA